MDGSTGRGPTLQLKDLLASRIQNLFFVSSSMKRNRGATSINPYWHLLTIIKRKKSAASAPSQTLHEQNAPTAHLAEAPTSRGMGSDPTKVLLFFRDVFGWHFVWCDADDFNADDFGAY